MEKQKTSRRISRLWLVALAAALALCLPFAFWMRSDASTLVIWVLDKTVPHGDCREHAGLFWILDYARIENPATGRVYDYSADYYGFHPEENGAYTVSNLPGGVENPALIYVADTYGVYREDYNQEAVHGDRGPTIYGGLTEKDLHSIESNLHGNTLIAEFNCLADPTAPEVREGFENVLGIDWEEWTGRYFDKLDRDGEVPAWMIGDYEKQYAESWNFTGPGVILTSSERKIAVLAWKEDFGPEGLDFIMEPGYQDEFGISGTIPYYSYFEFAAPREGTEVLASYRLDLTASGQAKLDALGLKSRLPAVLRKRSENYTAYYFAGDFADNVEIPSLYQYQGWYHFRKTFSIEIPGDQQAFYWRAYVPLMLKIIDDVKLQSQD